MPRPSPSGRIPSMRSLPSQTPPPSPSRSSSARQYLRHVRSLSRSFRGCLTSVLAVSIGLVILAAIVVLVLLAILVVLLLRLVRHLYASLSFSDLLTFVAQNCCWRCYAAIQTMRGVPVAAPGMVPSFPPCFILSVDVVHVSSCVAGTAFSLYAGQIVPMSTRRPQSAAVGIPQPSQEGYGADAIRAQLAGDRDVPYGQIGKSAFMPFRLMCWLLCSAHSGPHLCPLPCGANG